MGGWDVVAVLVLVVVLLGGLAWYTAEKLRRGPPP
jgi:hypothetical protein